MYRLRSIEDLARCNNRVLHSGASYVLASYDNLTFTAPRFEALFFRDERGAVGIKWYKEQ